MPPFRRGADGYFKVSRLSTGARLSEAWRANRPYLVDLAFAMLGAVGAAEDTVQEAFARLADAESGRSTNAPARLSTLPILVSAVR
jgi:DNA-directed RNA polymerase specialized sigma24 family protein